MRKFVVGFVLAGMVVGFGGADIRRAKDTSPAIVVPRKPCYGYTIIEFGKGINCHGDTIRPVKIAGGQEAP